MYFVDPELYRRYKDKVLKMSNAIQTGSRGRSIKEISREIGLSEDDVREILSIAEKDIPLAWYREGEKFKEEKCRLAVQAKSKKNSH